MKAAFIIKWGDFCDSSVELDGFFDAKVQVAHGGYLWQVGNGDDLVQAREFSQAYTDGLSDPATDTGIDFVKDKNR